MKDRPILETELALERAATTRGENMYAVRYRNKYAAISIEYIYGKDELDATIKAQKWLRDPSNGEVE